MAMMMKSAALDVSGFLPDIAPLMHVLIKDFHTWTIDASITKLAKESLITPPREDAPRKFDDHDIDTIHINAYDFSAWTYNTLAAITITTLALGTFGFLGFTSTVLSLLFFGLLTTIPNAALELTLAANDKGVLSLFEPEPVSQPKSAEDLTGKGESEETTGEEDPDLAEALAAIKQAEHLPLHTKRWMRLSDGLLPELPPGVEVDQAFADWGPDFISCGPIPLLKNTTLRLDFIWDKMYNPDRYEGQVQDFTQLETDAAAKASVVDNQ